MPSSGYAAITFVANEQPTTAKWNLIGSNDASFNTGAGFNDNIIVTRHFAAANVNAAALKYGQVYRRQGGNSLDPSVWGTTNYDWSAADLLVQIGFVNVSVGAGIDVTFPVAYSEKPWVAVTPATAIAANAWARHKQDLVTTTKITNIEMFNTAGSTTTTEGVTWIAIGKA